MSVLPPDLRRRLARDIFRARRLADTPAADAHWHRLLFTRFLAVNDLPAASLLPQIFPPGDPPPGPTSLAALAAALPDAIFRADDALGWVYQFWRADEKAAIDRAGDRLDAATLPAATQLFTEPYMVDFLLHNTLGAWWESKNKTSPVPLPSLRHDTEDNPAAGAFPGWPTTVRALRVLDPCAGSGHFLAALLHLLVPMLCHEEKIDAETAVRVVLGDVLHGLEIDPRCAQLAAFNVALAAWRLIGRVVPLPPLRVACCGHGVGATSAQWSAAAAPGDRHAMTSLHELFRRAPELGSLIDPAPHPGLLPAVRALLAADPVATPVRAAPGVVAAGGLADAADILAGRYHLIATNVPFKAARRLPAATARFLAEHFHAGRANLATAFLQRLPTLLAPGGAAALVTPQEWLFLGRHEPIRRHLLQTQSWAFLADLGEHAFHPPQGHGASTALVAFSNTPPDPAHICFTLDAATLRRVIQKETHLLQAETNIVPQLAQLTRPGARIGPHAVRTLPLLGDYADSFVGLQNGDATRFVRRFWELPAPGPGWTFFQQPCAVSVPFGGRTGLLRWEDGRGDLARSPGARVQGVEAWGKTGVAIRQTRSLPATFYTGDLYDQSSAAIIPKDPAHLPAVAAYCFSPEFHVEVRKIDRKKNVTNATLVKIPFDLAHWQRVAAECFPHGLPPPHSTDPTQWLFNGHPRGSDHPLHVAVARLLGYRWPHLDADELEPFADTRGVVCLSPPATARLHGLLAAAYGAAWSPAVLEGLLAAVGYGGKTLDDWLRDGFFAQHCRLFEGYPFVWQLWDGRRRGFSVLVNYHRFGRAALARLIDSELGDWIDAHPSDQAATRLREKLRLILRGETPHDIFVRWKPRRRQPRGWRPDLDDGVRLNIRPFVEAGVLRRTPRLRWGVDRGKNPPGAPWGERRDNDRHLTLDEKS